MVESTPNENGEVVQAGFMRQLLLPSNLLSLSRMVFAPLWFYALFLEHQDPGLPWLSLILSVLLASTDWLDGMVARARHEVSSLGLILDPLADKVVIVGGALFLALWWNFPIWVLILLASRDAVILVMSILLLRKRGKPEASRIPGKLTTLTLGMVGFFLLLRLTEVYYVLLGISLLLWLWSCVDYLLIFIRIVKKPLPDSQSTG